MICVKELSFQYDHQPRLIDNLNFSLPSKEITAIIGPNGSGKTTLLKLLTRSLKPEEGEVTIAGQSIWDLSAKDFAQQVAVVHQHNPLYDVIKVGELINFGQLPYHDLLTGADRSDQSKDAIVQQLGLTELVDRPMGSLSGGQQQLVWLATALNQSPQILVLDEPTTYLDLYYQVKLMHLIQKIQKTQQLTIIMILHDLNQVLHYADWCLLLKDGQLIDQGLPKEILTPKRIQATFNLATDMITMPQGAQLYIKNEQPLMGD